MKDKIFCMKFRKEVVSLDCGNFNLSFKHSRLLWQGSGEKVAGSRHESVFSFFSPRGLATPPLASPSSFAKSTECFHFSVLIGGMGPLRLSPSTAFLFPPLKCLKIYRRFERLFVPKSLAKNFLYPPLPAAWTFGSSIQDFVS